MKPYYEQDGITIYHGDCREVMASLPSGTVHAMATDTPYGVNLGEHLAAKDRRVNRVLVKDGYASYDDSPENFIAIVVPAIQQALALVERAAVFCAIPAAWRLPTPDAIGGVYLPSGCGRSKWGFTCFAPLWLYGSAPDLHKGARPTAIYSTASAEKNGHPCPKPLPWMTWVVNMVSRPGETVIDPFMGSGTTLRAAKDAGRRAIGVEIEERYCEIAAKRLAQGVLFGAGGAA